MTLENLLRMKVKSVNTVTLEEVEMSPEFRVSVQNDKAMLDGRPAVHIIIHAMGHNSDTLDFYVVGNKLQDIAWSNHLTGS